MGVLKLYDGTDWRNVGCGTQSAVWTFVSVPLEITDASPGEFTIHGPANTAVTLTPYINEVPDPPPTSYPYPYGASGGSTGPASTDGDGYATFTVNTAGVGLPVRWVLFGVGSAVVLLWTEDSVIEPVTGPPGRLKLWTGSEWVREKCDDDVATARPLKLWDGTAWQTVACMVPDV